MGYYGVFDANFGLQYRTDGTTWLPLSGWTVSPTYAYNSSSAGNATYTFSGPALGVLGVRVVGQVHTSDVGNNSWFARATEVQVFSGAQSPSPPRPPRSWNLGGAEYLISGDSGNLQTAGHPTRRGFGSTSGFGPTDVASRPSPRERIDRFFAYFHKVSRNEEAIDPRHEQGQSSADHLGLGQQQNAGQDR
jgi:hypothetical protein